MKALPVVVYRVRVRVRVCRLVVRSLISSHHISSCSAFFFPCRFRFDFSRCRNCRRVYYLLLCLLSYPGDPSFARGGGKRRVSPHQGGSHHVQQAHRGKVRWCKRSEYSGFGQRVCADVRRGRVGFCGCVSVPQSASSSCLLTPPVPDGVAGSPVCCRMRSLEQHAQPRERRSFFAICCFVPSSSLYLAVPRPTDPVCPVSCVLCPVSCVLSLVWVCYLV